MAYSELGAVNTLLIARGLVPVNTLDSGHPDVTAAQEILARRLDGVHSTNWWFNTEYNIQFTPAPDQLILLPSNVLRIDGTTHTILGGYLYDIANKTNLFEEDPDEMTVIYLRTWAELSTVPYYYVVALAKEEFLRPLESSTLTNMAMEDVKTAFAHMQRAQLAYFDPATVANPLVQKWRSKMIVR